ncbi:hypothetical protein [Reinekea blandensis]|uniref:Uncharacterized protein n=1 Tax=Reinekea blandensis MED297 TaxID=314283 RepID=A4BIR9_9GAMM|nr:hypothetical protein [Reinekea blandensis]EAR08033.1 hypothetical protein MED297_15725 [Reinekea sp. MED297] [Reinekea blandensis MED297]
MSGLVVILPILIIAGAFMWLRPSKRDQELSQLRSEALIRGFRVGSLKVPDTSEHGRIEQKFQIVTVYQKTLTVPREQTPAFVAVRSTGEPGIFLPDGWIWHERLLLDEPQYQVISDFLQQLPESVSVVSLRKDAVAISWDEKDPAVSFDVLDQWLKQLSVAFKRDMI